MLTYNTLRNTQKRPDRPLYRRRRNLQKRHFVLMALILIVWLVQLLPAAGACYARYIYPTIACVLTAVSDLIPFAVGDLFIALSIAWLVVWPFYARLRRKKPWRRIVGREVEYLLWIYVWFYLAWGLNYSQPNFYQRTGIAYTAYTPENFARFTDDYIERLNASYTSIDTIDTDMVRNEVVRGYRAISPALGVLPPTTDRPRAKTMLFTPLISMVGVTGSMGPFFCEFTLNGDLLPADYPATYAHELAHRLGITSEAEANFYAYQVCTRSSVPALRFSGYYSILFHVLGNARRLMDEAAYQALVENIRPEIIQLAKDHQAYWSAKYSPLVGAVQEWIYDLYLKGNKIDSGRQNYSEVVGLLISYEMHQTPHTPCGRTSQQSFGCKTPRRYKSL